MRPGLAWVAAMLISGSAHAVPPYSIIPGTFQAGRQPDGNSIILDAPRGLILIDTGRHPEQQERILAAARVRGKPIVAIINSHWHLDHTGGNQEIRAAYPSARIYASKAVIGALAGFLKESRKEAEEYLATGKAPDAQQAEIRADFAAMDDVADLMPTNPVTRSEIVRIGGRLLELHLAPHAATAGDVWVYDPASRTVFAGDLVVAFVPFLDTACAKGWAQALRQIEAVPFTTLVPGHGAPMSRSGFARWAAAFHNLLDCAAGDAPKGVCIAGWRKDAASFVGAASADRVDGLLGYYIDQRLRAPAGERDKYCHPVKRP